MKAEYMKITRTRNPAADVRRMDRRLFPADDPRPVGEDWWWEVRDAGGYLLAYAAATIHGRVCILSRCGVGRFSRGRGLQKTLIRVRERFASSHGCTTVATYVVWDNHPSINSLVGRGYRVCAPKKYGWENHTGFLVLHRPLTRDEPRPEVLE